MVACFLHSFVLFSFCNIANDWQIYGCKTNIICSSCLDCFEYELPAYANAFVSSGGGLDVVYAPYDQVVYACDPGFTSQSATAAITCTCSVDNIPGWSCDPPADANSEPCQPSSSSPGKLLHAAFRRSMCTIIAFVFLSESDENVCNKPQKLNLNNTLHAYCLEL